jgi:hypothetical protein
LSIVTFIPKSGEDGHPSLSLENSPQAVFTGRSPIIQITVIGKYLYCSTLRDSVSLLEYDNVQKTVRFVMSDPRSRLSTNHYIDLPESFIYTADKEGSVVGLVGSGISFLTG